MIKPFSLSLLLILSFASPTVFALKETSLENKVTELTQRTTALEILLRKSEPFRHDIKLRESVEKLETSEVYINQELSYVKEELSILNAYLREREDKDYSELIEDSIKEKVKDIEIKLADIEKVSKQALSAIKDSSEAAIEAAKTSAESSNNNFTTFLSIIQTWGIIFTAFATLFAVLIGFWIKNISVRAKKLKDATDNLENETLPKLDAQISKYERLKKELYYLNKMADLRENYNTYKTRRRNKERDPAPYEKLVKEALNKLLTGYSDLEQARENGELDSIDEKIIQETRSNLSYCYSVAGIIEYNHDNFERAYDNFSTAVKFNDVKIPDRFYNLACVASKMYQKVALPEYLDVILSNYIKLSEFYGETRHLVGDEDIKPIHEIINKKLRERELEHLIVPIHLSE